MKDLKIRVANKAESKEAQELFFELGYYWAYRNIGKKFHYEDGDVFIFAGSDRILGSGITENTDFFNNHRSKEITVQELRDMVVLKRNDVGDATHYDSHITTEKIKCILVGEWWNAFTGGKWQQHCHVGSGRAEYMKHLKEEEMKEYLFKYNNQYTLVELSKEDAESNPEQYIEIPDGANVYVRCNIFGDYKWLQKIIDGDWSVLWQREKESTMQEQLDYADELRNMGESGWSKEKHNHYKKDVSHLDMIDPYRIADLYALHPCADHIMKKSLCAGNRGHKDTLRDIQDIIDTAERWKQMIEEDSSEI